MSNLVKRILTALIAGSIAVTAIVLSGYGIWVFGVVVSIAGLWEFWNLADIPKHYRWPTLAFAVFGWIGLLLESEGILPPGVSWNAYILVAPALGLLLLFQGKEEKPIERMSEIILGMVYAYIPLVLLYKLSWVDGAYDFRIPLGLLIITWALDVGAFFAGKWFGKKHLFPRISPKKTWAGSYGGAIMCLIIAGLLQYFPETQEGISVPWIVSGMIIAVFGQWGDLIESMFKRSSKIKDSGSILPGHGGMLDRFDGMYITIPILYLIFTFGF